jgi:hypothetical protein
MLMKNILNILFVLNKLYFFYFSGMLNAKLIAVFIKKHYYIDEESMPKLAFIQKQNY